jgi:tetratricopeptide (TPR) repeat protein
MSENMTQKYLDSLDYWLNAEFDSLSHTNAANCYVKLDEFDKALQQYRKALQSRKKDLGMKLYLDANMIEKLPEVFILANEPQFYKRELENQTNNFRQKPHGGMSLVANYAYALTTLIDGYDSEIRTYVRELLRKPKVKDMYAIGQVLSGIVMRDGSAVDKALDQLVSVHNGQVKNGALRETPEGYISMAAMSLVKMCMDRGITTSIKSMYINREYLDFLNTDRSTAENSNVTTPLM